MAAAAKDKERRTEATIALNKRARYEYFIEEKYEAGMVLQGWEVKSLRAGKAQITEGYVLIKDRSKEIIISGGENISATEIENTLATHPAVLECAVVAAPDDQWGEIPVAIDALKPGQTATADELLAHCRARLAGFKLPKRIEFRDTLPKGGTGKILKAELREPFWKGQEKRVH